MAILVVTDTKHLRRNSWALVLVWEVTANLVVAKSTHLSMYSLALWLVMVWEMVDTMVVAENRYMSN